MSKANSTGTITLPTMSACAIWEHELTGQFSDGMWENAAPHDHWQFWCHLDVKFSPGELGVETSCAWKCKKTGYNIAALYEYVGDRMVAIGRMAKAAESIGMTIEQVVSDEFSRLAANNMPATLEQFNDMMTSGPRGMSDYAHDALKKVSPELAKAYYTTDYTMKHLKADVASIKSAMKSVKR